MVAIKAALKPLFFELGETMNYFFTATLLLINGSCAFAQVQRVSTLPLTMTVKSMPSSMGESYTPATIAMIENRAKVNANKTVAGVRYFSVTDADLNGKTGAALLERLSPEAIKDPKGLHRVEIVVDIKRPHVVREPANKPLAIGTTTLEGKVGNILVNSNILSSQLIIVK